MAYRRRILIAGLGVVLVAAPAWANPAAGLDLAVTWLAHMIVFNAGFGLIEGVVLSVLFRTPPLRSILLMIAANYFSAWIGSAILSLVHMAVAETGLSGPHYKAACATLITVLAVAMPVAVLLEWPLCRWAFRREHRGAWRSLLAVALVQLATHPILWWWYGSRSELSLDTAFEHDDSLSFVSSDLNATVYYITPRGAVARVGIQGNGRETLVDLGTLDRGSRLFTMQEPETGRWDLFAAGEVDSPPLIPGFAAVASPFLDPSWDDELAAEILTTRDMVEWPFPRWTADLRDATDRAWTVHAGIMPDEGLKAENAADGRTLRAALNAPFVGVFLIRDATVLPGDLVVFGLSEGEPAYGGDSHVMVLDLNRRTIGMLAEGRSPVVGIGTPAKADPEPDP